MAAGPLLTGKSGSQVHSGQLNHQQKKQLVLALERLSITAARSPLVHRGCHIDPTACQAEYKVSQFRGEKRLGTSSAFRSLVLVLYIQYHLSRHTV